jgi:putative acetyltransferase
MKESIRIAQVESEAEIDAVRTMLREYIEWAFTLEADSNQAPTFRGIEQELATLPGIYAPPTGRLLLATKDGEAAGCVCLKARDEATCEVKRLYVRQNMRGHNLGNSLIERLVSEARVAGYQRIVLDSHRSMEKAHAIYESAGFRRVPPPEDFPERLKSVAIFMEYRLTGGD